MGIITRLYHRSDGIADNPFNQFFLDMGENIHIHYRDLRVELSVDEFMEFAELCDVLLPQVKKEIENGYRDGVQPNTNQTGTWKQFSTGKPLKNTIAYHPNRISLEENSDGYHIHFRNYKFLLDKASFMNFTQAAKDVLDLRERPIDLRETLGLIAVNDLEHHVEGVTRDGERERAVIIVTAPYFTKTRQVLHALKYEKIEGGTEGALYEKGRQSVQVKVGALPNLPVPGTLAAGVVPLVQYIKENAAHFTAPETNLLKLQVMDFCEYARKNDLADLVELDYRKLFYDQGERKVIFPAKARPTPTNAREEWARVRKFFDNNQMGFVKPAKKFYSEEQLQRLDAAFRRYVREQLAPHPCVKKIYLLNPITWKVGRSGTGTYEVPFVHIDWVKLGSDFDILIEIDEDHPIPPDWDFKLFWNVCSSDYYHLGEVDFPIESPYIEKFPNIDFVHHMVEAYLFIASKGDEKIKDKYLAAFPTEVLFDRDKDSGATPRTEPPSTEKPAIALTAFVKKNAETLTPREFNLLKLQILDFFEHARNNDLGASFEFDHRKLTYDVERQKVGFPPKESPEPADLDGEYQRLSGFFADLGLSFVKPAKEPYPEAENQRLEAVFNDHVAQVLAAEPCVAKIYLLKATSPRRGGRYEVPFVHFDWAKLGSDFDLLIEIDERHPVPRQWALKFFWNPCSSDYYHLGDIDFPIVSPYIARFPNVAFHHHMIEAYLFFPSKGNQKVKDDYLKKFDAGLIYEKEPPRGRTADRLSGFVAERYGLTVNRVEDIDIPGLNEVIRVTAEEGDFAAKIMKKEDFTPAVEGRSGNHNGYEAALLLGLSAKDVPVVFPLPGKDGKTIQDFGKRDCLLFPFIETAAGAGGNGAQAKAAAKTLALVHKEALEVDVPTDIYRFDVTADYWIRQYQENCGKLDCGAERHNQFGALIPQFKQARNTIVDAQGVPWLHCHGDVCPRNFFHVGGQAILFDFQAAHFGPRIEDLSEGALEFALKGAALDPILIDGFVAAYEEQNPLGEEERALLPTMLFLQAMFKLGRLFRLEVKFGYPLNEQRTAAFLNYAMANVKDLF